MIFPNTGEEHGKSDEGKEEPTSKRKEGGWRREGGRRKRVGPSSIHIFAEKYIDFSTNFPNILFGCLYKNPAVIFCGNT